MKYYIGLMSGTSLDAIDAVLVSFADKRPVLHHAINYPLSKSLRDDILALCTPGENEIDRMGQLDIMLSTTFASAVKQLLADADINAAQIYAIGSHGQTIRHRPGRGKEKGFTLQIGDPNTIAELTGITTVADFRRRDMAVGGQGAPLVPAFHAAFFSTDTQARVILNIGGMANITLLPMDTKTPVSGFDTGPGNILLDSWIQQQQQQPFDHDGQWATSGTAGLHLLDMLLKDSFFKLTPPKSTGREYFNLSWLQQYLDKCEHTLAPVDVQTTLSELTATSIADAIKKYAGENTELVVCGGGVRNTDLMQRIAKKLALTTVKTSDDYGLAAEWVEAVAFAWLARERLAHRPGNLPDVTGAHRSVLLGGIYPGYQPVQE